MTIGGNSNLAGSIDVTGDLNTANSSLVIQDSAVINNSTIYVGDGAANAGGSANPTPGVSTLVIGGNASVTTATFAFGGTGGAKVPVGTAATLQGNATLDVTGAFDVLNDLTGTTVAGGSTLTTFNLNAGTLEVGTFTTPTGGNGTQRSQFNFNGGVLEPLASDSSGGGSGIFVPSATTWLTEIGTGGAIINTNGFSVEVTSQLTHGSGTPDGGLTKLGAGTLTLRYATNPNDYTGITTVLAGDLNIDTIYEIGGTAYAGLTLNGGTLQYATGLTGDGYDDLTANNNSAPEPFVVGTNGGTVDLESQNLSFANPITGAGSFTVTDSLASPSSGLQLNGTSSYAGSTTVSSTTLTINGALTSSGTINVNASTAATTLLLDGADAVPATAALIGTGTFGPTITVNANQIIGSINSVGSTTFDNGSTSTVGPIDGSGTLNVSSTSSLTAGHIRQGILNIDSTSIVTIADSANPGTTTATSILTDLNNSGTLDLKNNDLIITDTTQFSAVQSAITNAYNGGAWNQPGITSSSAAVHPNQYGLGYATAGAVNLSTFDGQTVSGGTVLVKYTLLGDALLTGTVGLGDFNRVLANFNTGTLWSQGAFHPGSAVGLADYNAVIANFNATASGSVAVKPAIKTAALSFSPDAATDLKLEVNTVTGDVYALATATTALTGYDIFDKSGNLLDSGDPNTDLNERLLSQPSSTTLGNQTTFRNATNYKLWATILDNTSTLAEGSNNGKLKQGTASTYDTINIPANGTIDFGDIYNTVAHNNDITFAFSEADPTNAGNPVTGSTYNGEVDYVGNTVMPEPGTLGLLGMGGIMMMRRRRRAARI